MRLVLFGPPGAGKGTQAVRVASRLGIAHVSTGDVFRAALRAGTPVGMQAREFLDSGRLVPDGVVCDVVAERLQQADAQPGYLLDGFPRTVEQARRFDELLPGGRGSVDRVVSMEVDDEQLVQRLSGRRVCASCGEVYHVQTHAPVIAGACDKCGGALAHRTDDGEAVIRHRLQVFRDETLPVAGYYRDRGVVVAIDATGTADDVTERILRVLGVGAQEGNAA